MSMKTKARVGYGRSLGTSLPAVSIGTELALTDYHIVLLPAERTMTPQLVPVPLPFA